MYISKKDFFVLLLKDKFAWMFFFEKAVQKKSTSKHFSPK